MSNETTNQDGAYDPPPVDWEALARAEVGNMRIRVFELFSEKPRIARSAKMVGDELGISARQAAYHVKALRESGLLLVASRHRRRGAIETRYTTYEGKVFSTMCDGEKDPIGARNASLRPHPGSDAPPFPRRLLTDAMARAIVGRLAMAPSSAAEVAAELGVPAEGVRRRMRELHRQGWIVQVGKTRRRGVPEFLYCLDLRRGVLRSDQAAEIPTALLERFTTRTLRLVVREAIKAMDTGTFASRPEHVLTRFPLPLDERGLREGLTLHEELVDRVIESAERGKKRIESGDERPIAATAGIMFFEAADGWPTGSGGIGVGSPRRASSRHPVDVLASIADPLRMKIVDVLSLEPLGAEELARRLAAPLQKVRYELERLRAAGVVVVHSRHTSRGLVAQTYLCENRSLATFTAEMAEYDGERLEVLCRALTTAIFHEALDGIRSGSFAEWNDDVLVRVPMVVDRQAFCEMSELMTTLLQRMFNLKESCFERSEASGAATNIFFSNLLLFEQAPGRIETL